MKKMSLMGLVKDIETLAPKVMFAMNEEEEKINRENSQAEMLTIRGKAPKRRRAKVPK
jgi:hypothetical protein